MASQRLVDVRRIKSLSDFDQSYVASGPVVYWTTRDHRAHDHWGLLYAQTYALVAKQPLVVVCAFRNDLRSHSVIGRTWNFLTAGIDEMRHDLADLNIPMLCLVGDPVDEVHQFCEQLHAGMLVVDQHPIRPFSSWHAEIAGQLSIPVFQVDSHNVVPVWIASDKKEYAAYTIRKKLHDRLDEFLTPIPALVDHPHSLKPDSLSIGDVNLTDAVQVAEKNINDSSLKPGHQAGMLVLDEFLENIEGYDELRNDPTAGVTSQLSAYLHFGHISPSVVVERARGLAATNDRDAFIEEVFVRRELSDNYCFYCPDYDSTEGYADWARTTLKEHADDEREYVYDYDTLELANTHEPLWNACQNQMVYGGYMHGYMRMYWAKKILEWTESAAVAHAYAIRLNDTYELDGRDPNGYTGVAWAIGGVHDRAWQERKVFGKIRYMNANGARRKFDVATYINSVEALVQSTKE